MKQRGFTLAEVLIALCIIGVIAAITMPMVNKFRPDKTKVLYLHSYDSLTLAVGDIANNTEIYPEIGNNNLVFKDYPFMNFNAATYAGNNISGGTNKLCRALATSFNILEDVESIVSDTTIACNDTYTAYNRTTNSPFNISFTNKNGVEFMITTNANNPILPAPQANTYTTDVIIDINGSDIGNGPNCVYNESSCKNPDRFTFKIGADGTLRPTDEAGLFFIDKRTSYNLKDIVVTDELKDILNKNNEDFEAFVISTGNGGNDSNGSSGNEDDNSGSNGASNSGDNGDDDSSGNKGSVLPDFPINDGLISDPGSQKEPDPIDPTINNDCNSKVYGYDAHGLPLFKPCK